MNFKGVIFDLDGVIVTTDNYHYLAWKKMADDEKIYFDRKINDRLRGVSRQESLEIILEKSKKVYSSSEKLILSEKKNNYYKQLIENLCDKDILRGVLDFLNYLKASGVKLAIGSSSKNTKPILSYIGLDDFFDIIVDGNDILRSKPDNEVFSKACALLGFTPEECLVVEDADAGVQASIAAGIKVLAVSSAMGNKKAHYTQKDLSNLSELKKIVG